MSHDVKQRPEVMVQSVVPGPQKTSAAFRPDLLTEQVSETVPPDAEEALAFAATVLQSSEDAIIGMSPDAVVRSWNAGAERIYGYTAGEMIGQSFSLLVPEEMRAEHERRRVGLLQSGQGASVEATRRRRDGTRIDISTRVSLIQDETGRVTGMVSVARDVTEQKRAEDALRESEQRYRGLVDALPQLVWLTGTDGALLYVNPGWTEYTGYGREDTATRVWKEILSPEDAARVQAAWEAGQAAGQPYGLECRLRRADGEFRWFLMRAVPLPDAQGRAAQWLGTGTDIHDQKQAERTQTFLADLVARVSRTPDPQALLWEAVTALGRFLGVSRCAYCETDVAASLFTVHSDFCDGVRSVAGTYTRQGFGADVIRELTAGLTVVIDDARTDSRTAAQYAEVYAPLEIHASLNVPVMSRGRQIGTLTVQQAGSPRVWTPAEAALVEAVAEQTHLALENARLERALQREAGLQRRFLRDVLASVTEGRLTLCAGPEELPAPLGSSSPPVLLSMAGGLSELRGAVRAAARAAGLSPERCDDLLTAAGEAGMNAVVHVGAGVGQVFADGTAGRVQVKVVDTGSGIAIADLPSAALRKGYTTAGTLGHGMKMMLQTADRVYLLTGGTGTTVVIEQERLAAPEAW